VASDSERGLPKRERIEQAVAIELLQNSETRSFHMLPFVTTLPIAPARCEKLPSRFVLFRDLDLLLLDRGFTLTRNDLISWNRRPVLRFPARLDNLKSRVTDFDNFEIEGANESNETGVGVERELEENVDHGMLIGTRITTSIWADSRVRPS